MENFCCDQFRVRHGLNALSPLNIRIIKVKAENGFLKLIKTSDYQVFITSGYKEGEKNVAVTNIKYCPFCGTKLNDHYTKDEYVNELDHTFLEL